MLNLKVSLFLCTCVTGCLSINLQFTSHNCDEDPRMLTMGKSYNLTWNGQITPKICSFRFSTTTGYKVCFESVMFDFPYQMNHVELKIKNYTKKSWVYDRFDDNVPRTCVNNAYKLNVSLILPTNYRPPSQQTYIILALTATEIPEDYFSGIITTITAVISAGIFLFCVACIWRRNTRDTVGLDGFLKCFLTCQSCRWLNRKFIHPLVETCCSKLTSRQNTMSDIYPNETTQRRQASHEELNTSEVTGSTQVPEMNNEQFDPMAPPPSYDQVVGNTYPTPTAPPLKSYNSMDG